MAALTDSEWGELTRDLARRVDAVAPGWTDQGTGDPGITIAELLAFLGESLLTRAALSQAARTRLRDVVTDLEQGLALPCHEVPRLSRVRYFAGRVLSATDFELEQSYVRHKQRRHNLLLHGVGIVRGLEVTVEPGDARGRSLVAVSPGLAIGPDGEELLVCDRLMSRLAAGRSSGYVTLRVVDRLLDAVLTPGGEEASPIEEVVEVEVRADVPPPHLAIARVERANGSWRLDPRFNPPRPADRRSGHG